MFESPLSISGDVGDVGVEAVFESSSQNTVRGSSNCQQGPVRSSRVSQSSSHPDHHLTESIDQSVEEEISST